MKMKAGIIIGTAMLISIAIFMPGIVNALSNQKNISNTSPTDESLSLVESYGSNIYYVYRTSDSKLKFLANTNNGDVNSWGSSYFISSSSHTVTDFDIDCDRNGDIYVVYHASVSGSNKIWCTKSTNDGVSFSTPVDVLGDYEGTGIEPKVASDNKVHILYIYVTGSDRQLYYVYSSDGSSWSNPNLVTGAYVDSSQHDIDVKYYYDEDSESYKEKVYTVWRDDQTGQTSQNILFREGCHEGSFSWTDIVNFASDLFGTPYDYVIALPFVAVVHPESSSDNYDCFIAYTHDRNLNVKGVYGYYCIDGRDGLIDENNDEEEIYHESGQNNQPIFLSAWNGNIVIGHQEFGQDCYYNTRTGVDSYSNRALLTSGYNERVNNGDVNYVSSTFYYHISYCKCDPKWDVYYMRDP